MTDDTQRRTTEGSHRGSDDRIGAAPPLERDGHSTERNATSRGTEAPGAGIDVLQISSSQMEFFKDQVRVLEELGVSCDSLSYPPDPGHTEGEVRRQRLHEGFIRRIYGHNPFYYAYRAADFYPRILATAVGGDYDLVHLNSGMVAPLGLLQPERPIVLTLWGDDLLGDRLGGYQPAITRFCAKRADRVVVRSEEMRRALPCEAHVIPSGIDTKKFRPIPRTEAREAIGWEVDARHVLFPYPEDQTKKRYGAAERIVAAVDERFAESVRLQVVSNVPHEEMYRYYNAADALLLPSRREGSPNTVKEAMACNVPVVSTDVGDVATRLGPVENSHVCRSDEELTEALTRVLEDGGRSNGREHVAEVSLERMGERLISIYESVLAEAER